MSLCRHCGSRITKLGDLWHHITERIAHQQIQLIIHGKIVIDVPAVRCTKVAEPIDFSI